VQKANMKSQRSRRSKKAMFQLIEKWEASNVTINVFCREQGIARSVFHYWNKKYKLSKPKAKGGFIPIEVQHVETPPLSVIEIEYPNGMVVRLPDVTPVSIVKQYIHL
jgi:hypothetical protein